MVLKQMSWEADSLKRSYSFFYRFKDGAPIKASDRFIIQATEDGSYSLTIKDATTSDAGLYRCIAGNSLGSANTVGNVRVEGE